MILTWPEFLNFAAIKPSIARFKSAESKTIKGALPPNSKPILLTPPEHKLYSNFPTAVEPKKII